MPQARKATSARRVSGEDGSWKIQAQIWNSSLPDEM